MIEVSRATIALLASVTGLALAAGCSPAASNGTASAPTGFGALLQPASLAGIGMTTFTDPTENAFTVSVPQGWTVKGGMQQTSPIAAKSWVSATSPDGATTITLGDPSLSGFTLPSPTGGGGQNPVEPYENGVAFAADYAQRAFGSTCSPLTPAGSQAEPALAQKIEAKTAQGAAAVGISVPPGLQYDGGSETFTCQSNGVAYAVGVIDVTSVMQTPTGGSWSVPTLFAYRTPAASQAQTDQLSRAMNASYQINPQFQAQMQAAERQQLATIQQQGQQRLAAGRQEAAAFSQMMTSAANASMAQQANSHAAFMQQQAVRGQAIQQNFAAQQASKASGQQAEMRYINNQQCIRWADAAHTQCTATAPN